MRYFPLQLGGGAEDEEEFGSGRHAGWCCSARTQSLVLAFYVHHHEQAKSTADVDSGGGAGVGGGSVHVRCGRLPAADFLLVIQRRVA